MHGVARDLVEREGVGPTQVVERFRQHAEGDHDVVVDFVESNMSEACDDVEGKRDHPEGPHFHCRNVGTERIVPVSVGTVKNFVSKLGRRAT
jgi:hypothetical protein